MLNGVAGFWPPLLLAVLHLVKKKTRRAPRRAAARASQRFLVWRNYSGVRRRVAKHLLYDAKYHRESWVDKRAILGVAGGAEVGLVARSHSGGRTLRAAAERSGEAGVRQPAHVFIRVRAMTVRTRLLVVTLLPAALLSGCHRASPPTVAAFPAAHEDYCWWTAFRTDVPVDTVAARFRLAFSSLGLTVSDASTLADTAWVNASARAVDSHSEVVGARMVAYRIGDSTHFRSYVTLLRPSDQTISTCAQIAQKAAVRALAPRTLDGEEKLDVWRRRP
jgi:hypothetical protein